MMVLYFFFTIFAASKVNNYVPDEIKDMLEKALRERIIAMVHREVVPAIGCTEPMGMALFTGWFVPKARYQGSHMVTVVYLFILRWIVPIALIIIVLDSMNIIKI